MDLSKEIMTLDNHTCINKTVVQALLSVERLGKEQYSKYVNDERKISLRAINKTQLPLFQCRH